MRSARRSCSGISPGEIVVVDAEGTGENAVFTFSGAAKSAVPDTVEVAVAEVVESAEGSEATGTE